MTEPNPLGRLTTLRLAGTLAGLAGIASWWTSYWIGLTVTLAALTGASLLVGWGAVRRHRRMDWRRAPALFLVVSVLGWVTFVGLALVRSRASGLALGASSLVVAWLPSWQNDDRPD